MTVTTTGMWPSEQKAPTCVDCKAEIAIREFWASGRCMACTEIRHSAMKATPGDHYRARGGIEPIDFITSNDLDFLEGNVVKYVSRYGHKDGLKDLAKALDYLQRLIAREERKVAVAVEAEARGQSEA